MDFPGTLYGVETEIEFRIDCAESKFYQHSKKFFNHNISLKTRTTIFNALVRSRLTYGCQTWSLNTAQLQRIVSCYMGMLRKMVRKGYRRIDGTFRYAISNVQLLRTCGTSCISDFIATQQKKYLAHVVRISDTCIAKKLLFNGSISRRPGRELTLFSMVINREQCTENEFLQHATDRIF